MAYNFRIYGVFAILLQDTKQRKDTTWLEKGKEAVKVSSIIQIMLFPILIHSFHQISFAFVFSTIVTTPILTILLFFGMFTFFFWKIQIPIAIFLTKPIHFFCAVFEKIAEGIAHIPGITAFCITPKPYWIFLYYLFLFGYILLKKQKRKRVKEVQKRIGKKILLCILALNLVLEVGTIVTRKFTIHFLDVGQGDACLIQTRAGKTLLIDGGGNAKEEYDPGKQVLLPFLAEHQIGRLDCLFVSHADLDHIGGTIAVLEKIPVKKIILGKQFEENANLEKLLQLAKRRKITVEIVEEGMEIKVEKDVSLSVIWPSRENRITENGVNNNSLVFRLSYSNFSMLFTGDIEKIAEEKILEQVDKNRLKADVLKVGHHGSKTSSISEWVEAVKPKIALIGVGENNRFGHPNGEVVERLEKSGAKVYRTDEDGEIFLQIDRRGRIRAKKWLEK